MKLASSNSHFLVVGKVCGPHGVKGEVKLENYCDDFEMFSGIKKYYLKNEFGFSEFAMSGFRLHGSFILACAAELCGLDYAKWPRNRLIYAQKSDIPLRDGRAFVDDLLGCEIVDFEKKNVYGVLRDVLHGHSNEIYEIESAVSPKKFYYLPILDETLKGFDEANKRIFVTPLAGVFDNEN